MQTGNKILEDISHKRYLQRMAKLYFFISANKKEYIESLKKVEDEVFKIIKSQNKPLNEVMNDIIKHRNHGV